jgi:hypothetical protein
LLDYRSRLVGGGGLDAIEERRTQEPYSTRKIHFSGRITADEARFTVRDDGPGFDHTAVPSPLAPENLEKESGRGLVLIHSFMDEVLFNGSGNELTMIKFREGPSEGYSLMTDAQFQDDDVVVNQEGDGEVPADDESVID